jgi:diguanylate cyclase (GGDEF)-like protein
MGDILPGLFTGQSGALYAVPGGRNAVRRVVSWGQRTTASSFPPDECVALRTGEAHVSHDEPPCTHADVENGGHVCVPLLDRSGPIGLLHVTCPADEPVPAFADVDGPCTTLDRAQPFADRAELALANIALHEAVKSQAVRDSLTGAFNRRYMEESLDRELHRAERRYTSLGIVLIDVDSLARFNEIHGRAAGDTLLQELATFLRGHVRGEDIVCRYGAEEFVLVLPEASLENARRRADLLRERIKRLQITHRGQPLGAVTVSAGIAVYPDHGATTDALLRAAEAAVDAAKAAGRDRIALANRQAAL